MSLRREPPSRCSLLIRNLPKSVRSEDLRYTAEKYGDVRDVYIPRDYYTGEPRGLGFVEFTNAKDAEDAKYALDRSPMGGREISVVFALQGRKRPDEYRGRGGGGGGSYRGSRRSRSRTPPRRSHRRSYSRSRSRERDRSYTPASPRRRRRSYSRSPSRSRSPKRSRSPAPARTRSPASRSASPRGSPRRD
ncbi:hypothetical protein WJX74_001112 [Apatococcus lobatus]|uniref:RRM domain-containing protein n=1 Tax=Apatococcus lobatus TaxID=904363 RepID=A0AAW1SEE0_9CHLO